MNRRDSLVGKRTERGMSQRQVVMKLNNDFGITITDSYYGMIEQGKRTPKLELALAIAKLFNCSPEDIFLNKNTTKRWVVA